MNKINHHHLYLFWTFGKNESFTKTAETLKIAQSAVTSQLKLLEESLGVELIDRTNIRKPSLTSEGRKVLEYAETIFETSNELYNWLNGNAQKTQKIIRIGAISGLSRNVQFEFIFPFIKSKDIKFEIITNDQKNLLQQLRQHEIDVVLTSHNTGYEKSTGFFSHVLTRSPVVIVKANQKNKKENIDFKEYIKDHPLIIPGSNFEARAELDAYLNKLKTTPKIFAEIDDIALLRIMALRSGYLVALPLMGVQNDVANGDLKIVSKISGVDQKFYAITISKKIPNKEVHEMIDRLQKLVL